MSLRVLVRMALIRHDVEHHVYLVEAREERGEVVVVLVPE